MIIGGNGGAGGSGGNRYGGGGAGGFSRYYVTTTTTSDVDWCGSPAWEPEPPRPKRVARCDYCNRLRRNAFDNCAGCGAPS